MMKKLLIDLDICEKCEECASVCSYIQHPANNGITCLRELAHFAVNCRRCDDEPCIGSCPWEALEKQPDRILKRYLMRCTSCKSCSLSCPFGTIYPETIPFVVSRCDFCLGRLTESELPVCLQSCGRDGVKYGDFEENKEENPVRELTGSLTGLMNDDRRLKSAAFSNGVNIYKVSEYMLVRTNYKWERNPEPAVKKK